VGGIQQALVASVGVSGGHHTLHNAELGIQDLRPRREYRRGTSTQLRMCGNRLGCVNTGSKGTGRDMARFCRKVHTGKNGKPLLVRCTADVRLILQH
jgi:hypothetical protein